MITSLKLDDRNKGPQQKNLSPIFFGGAAAAAPPAPMRGEEFGII
jgi:hypothetical protein